MDLVDKALQLYDEIESRQRQLREILEQLQALKQEKQSDDGVVNEHKTEVATVVETVCEPVDNPADEHVVNIVVEPVGKTVAMPEVSQIPYIEPVAAMRPRPDLWKSLTINDRFRFRRELFAGDDTVMSAAINRLSEMDTLSEADEYLSTMPWESDSEAVSEFMTILSNHFSRF